MPNSCFNIRIILMFLCLIAFASCLPRPPQSGTEETSNTGRGGRRAAASAGSSRNNTSENAPTNGRKTRSSAAVAEVPIDSDSLRIARLAAQAVAQKNVKPSQRRSSAGTNPFARRQELLNDVADESERFIDTTYYMLKMEEGTIEIVSDVATGGERTQEFYEKLIRDFMKAQADAEQSATFDCNVFNIYASQFSFNDSLFQEAQYSFAECNISNDRLEEAAAALETLCSEKMHKDVAPKALVRLGQVYCILGDNAKARRYFNRLKKEFPRSVYNQLADCGRL